MNIVDNAGAQRILQGQVNSGHQRMAEMVTLLMEAEKLLSHVLPEMWNDDEGDWLDNAEQWLDEYLALGNPLHRVLK